MNEIPNYVFSVKRLPDDELQIRMEDSGDPKQFLTMAVPTEDDIPFALGELFQRLESRRAYEAKNAE